MSNVCHGWNAALEWAAQYIEACPSTDSQKAMSVAVRAKKGDVDMLLVGIEAAWQVWRDKQRDEQATP